MSQFVPMVTTIDHDALISWDFPHAFRYADRAKVHILAFQLNHTEIGVFDHVIDRYWHPSRWHASRFAELWPAINPKKQSAVMTNGVDLSRYTSQVGSVLRDAGKVIYSSSPDRGLHHLLRIWPAVVDAVPTARLDVYYEIEKWLAMDAEIKHMNWYQPTGSRADLIRAAYSDPPVGVRFLGGVGQTELARAQLDATVLCYPCDPVAPTEGFSMTVLEGLTAGCQVITTPVDALGELWGGMRGCTILPLPIHDETWADNIVMALMGAEDKPPERLRELVYHQWSTVVARQIKEVQDAIR
jgi:glycosyltransferase involved in cell wall biosynthesis